MSMDRLRLLKGAVPAAMSCVSSGLFLIAASITLPHLFSGLDHPSQIGDFLRGLATGIGIGLEIGGIAVLLPSLQAIREQRRERA